jgi:hypothetical protein
MDTFWLCLMVHPPDQMIASRGVQEPFTTFFVAVEGVALGNQTILPPGNTQGEKPNQVIYLSLLNTCMHVLFVDILVLRLPVLPSPPSMHKLKICYTHARTQGPLLGGAQYGERGRLTAMINTGDSTLTLPGKQSSDVFSSAACIAAMW